MRISRFPIAFGGRHERTMLHGFLRSGQMLRGDGSPPARKIPNSPRVAPVSLAAIPESVQSQRHDFVCFYLPPQGLLYRTWAFCLS